MFARSIVINTSRSASGLIARETWRTDGGTVSAGDFILTLYHHCVQCPPKADHLEVEFVIRQVYEISFRSLN